MRLKGLLISGLISTLSCSYSYSQVTEQVNYGLHSPETLEIKTIETINGKTVIWLNVENRITGGQFCADKNLFMVYPDGSRSKLISSNGIPVCPSAYKFKYIGEKLDFTLTFPELKKGTEWFDLIEECNDNCFSFYGVTLNSDLNKSINEAIQLAGKGETQKSIEGYKKIIEGLSGKNNGIEGALYTDLISLLVKTGRKEEAKTWYSRMTSSNAPRLELYIQNLTSRGIKF